MLEENLKKIRRELGLSVAKLSEKLEIPAMTLTNYERGARTPSAQLFIQLNRKLNINLNWFATGEGEMFNADTPDNFKKLKDKLLIEVREMLVSEGILK